MAIMGPSGCGKTTLLNMIGHLDRRSSGDIIINDIDTSTLSDAQMTAFRRDNIGFIFQLFNLFPFLTAVENVETPASKRNQRRISQRTSKNATTGTRHGR
jgi:putative ABC transport system ATP-binding protein